MDSLKIFDGLPDPREQHLITYELKSLVFITISAVVSGYDTFTDIALFAKYKRDWITRFVPLPKGKTPSHDIFGDLFSSLCTESFCDHFVSWVSMISNITCGELIAIDGKRIRGSYDRFKQKAAIHVVSAWAQQNSLVLGQVKVDDKSNEITAIPKILEMLEMKGAIISIDAVGCQKEIAEDIIERQGDYILALKGNQKALSE
ncbi:MAG: ISAs1 family transposase [Crocinitomicaceae bacterium]|nr:ISAs1 family transposase [Crocinitomicaceae bacterium]